MLLKMYSEIDLRMLFNLRHTHFQSVQFPPVAILTRTVFNRTNFERQFYKALVLHSVRFA